jgi:hypothetical protein
MRGYPAPRLTGPSQIRHLDAQGACQSRRTLSMPRRVRRKRTLGNHQRAFAARLHARVPHWPMPHWPMPHWLMPRWLMAHSPAAFVVPQRPMLHWRRRIGRRGAGWRAPRARERLPRRTSDRPLPNPPPGCAGRLSISQDLVKAEPGPSQANPPPNISVPPQCHGPPYSPAPHLLARGAVLASTVLAGAALLVPLWLARRRWRARPRAREAAPPHF